MKKEQGFSTLLITVVISLIMALYVFSLLSVELFNSKKTQNVILAQEVKAKANSGLQCAVDIIIRTGKKPDSSSIDYSPCNDAVIRVERIETSNKYKVIAKSVIDEAEAVSSRIIASSSTNGVKSTFSSTGSVKFNGSYVFSPYEGIKDKRKYKCSTIRSGGSVSINGILTVMQEPRDQNGHFKVDSDGDVISCYSSHTTQDATSSADFKEDIEQNIIDLDLFKDNFAVDREQWPETQKLFDKVIKGAEKTTQIVGGDGKSKNVNHLVVTDCAAEINKIIKHNEREFNSSKNSGTEPDYIKYVWLEGSCDLSGIKYKIAEKNAVAITLVVQDGLLTYNGNGYFHGNIYLFDYAMTNDQLLAAWNNNSLKSIAEAFVDLKNAPFYFFGAFETRGAFNLDSPNRKCEIGGAFKPGYSKGKVDYEDSRFGKTVVLEGSWHDF